MKIGKAKVEQWKKRKMEKEESEDEAEDKPEDKPEDENALDWWFNWTIDQPIENPNLGDEIQQVLYSLLLLNPLIMIHQ